MAITVRVTHIGGEVLRVGEPDVRVTHVGGELLRSDDEGTVCWGHDTAVVEVNIRDFLNRWTGDASIIGVDDAERMLFYSGDAEESETWPIGVGRVRITIDSYDVGEGASIVKYKQGNSWANCEADAWNAYTIPFICEGWIKIRIEAP